MKPNVSTGLFGYPIAGHLGHRSFLIKSVFLIRGPHTKLHQNVLEVVF